MSDADDARIRLLGGWDNWTGEWCWFPSPDIMRDGLTVADLAALMEQSKRLPNPKPWAKEAKP